VGAGAGCCDLSHCSTPNRIVWLVAQQDHAIVAEYERVRGKRLTEEESDYRFDGERFTEFLEKRSFQTPRLAKFTNAIAEKGVVAFCTRYCRQHGVEIKPIRGDWTDVVFPYFATVLRVEYGRDMDIWGLETRC